MPLLAPNGSWLQPPQRFLSRNPAILAIVAQVQDVVLIALHILVRAPLLFVGSLIMAVATSPRLALILLASLRSDGWTAWSEHVDEFSGLRTFPATFRAWPRGLTVRAMPASLCSRQLCLERMVPASSLTRRIGCITLADGTGSASAR